MNREASALAVEFTVGGRQADLHRRRTGDGSLTESRGNRQIIRESSGEAPSLRAAFSIAATRSERPLPSLTPASPPTPRGNRTPWDSRSVSRCASEPPKLALQLTQQTAPHRGAGHRRAEARSLLRRTGHAECDGVSSFSEVRSGRRDRWDGPLAAISGSPIVGNSWFMNERAQ